MQNLPIAENRPEFDSVITSISASSFTHIVLSNWIQRHHVRRWGRLMLAEKTKGDRSLRPWQTRTHCSGHIVADTNVSPFARARNICCRHKFCVRDTKNVSDFVQKHYVSATNVSQFAQHKKHHGQQCVRSNVSSFTRALRWDVTMVTV